MVASKAQSIYRGGKVWVSTIFHIHTRNGDHIYHECLFVEDECYNDRNSVYDISLYRIIAQPIEKIRTQMEELQRADASIGRIQDLFNIESMIKEGDGHPLPQGHSAVHFEHVNFGYVETITF